IVRLDGPLFVISWASSSCVEKGEQFQVRATVTNQGTKTQVIELKENPVLDIWIGPANTPLARWSDGKTRTSDLTRLELKPGESKSVEMTFVEKLGSGAIPIEARFTYDDRFPPSSVDVFVDVGNCLRLFRMLI
ncbi:MAG TPA: BsuPI-related putative proteinase inhibitor, partial [Puia sp.]|nr:BsuPI-related putative proteinase inhibitor [Puia sp.]